MHIFRVLVPGLSASRTPGGSIQRSIGSPVGRVSMDQYARFLACYITRRVASYTYLGRTVVVQQVSVRAAFMAIE